MATVEQCAEVCPIVSLLTMEQRLEVLGGHALDQCMAEPVEHGRGKLCVNPDYDTKNKLTRAALAKRHSGESTV